MTVVYHDNWDLSTKGKKDAERHRKKIEDNIKNINLNKTGEKV